ncbi:hypothetical protein N0V90_007568 [Kalmusia sp. IMI 367209]|nr:hypothetical protein N0V90_007568 [Kalmusia sp. IMI 367209]
MMEEKKEDAQRCDAVRTQPKEFEEDLDGGAVLRHCEFADASDLAHLEPVYLPTIFASSDLGLKS